MKNARDIIKKWYERLGFRKEYDEEFHKALESAEIPESLTVGTLDTKREPSCENLLYVLYLCEEVEEEYRKMGIPEDILLDTLRDITVWTDTWTGVKGYLALGQLDWLSHHLKLNLFKLGRLQFYRLCKAKDTVPEVGVTAGDAVIDIHIPATGRLDIDECKKSLEQSKVFFRKYYPDFDFKCFACHSWLLDDTLKKYLPADGNIIRFGNMFTKTKADPDFALVRYMFEWDTTVENLPTRVPKTGAARKIKEAILSGEQCHATQGYIAL
jgi:hypothetical protein